MKELFTRIGVNVNIDDIHVKIDIDELGRKLIYITILSENTKIAHFLMNEEADINTINEDGQTPLDKVILLGKILEEIGQPQESIKEIIAVLKAYRAKTAEELRELRAKRKKIKDLLVKILEEKKQNIPPKMKVRLKKVPSKLKVRMKAEKVPFKVGKADNVCAQGIKGKTRKGA